MTEQQAKKALSIGFASPIIGAALGVLMGLAIFDLFNAFEEWTTVVLIALLGFSIWLGATKSGDALSYDNKHGGLTAAKGAANLNSVLAIVWMVIGFITSLVMGLSALQNFRQYPEAEMGQQPYNPGAFTVEFDSSVFFGEFIPAVVIVAMSMFGFVFMLVATSKVAK